ncbi:Tubulin beta-3 chain-like Protein [Tribolium castaneum]|uniref:Tubulin beta-3 chain-like Protein n=1 Tax=Tribolium castaneum TaxID=7070 RepID=D6WCX3_TRICA|nr:PREDICTED: tubulin epsilon chain [Tribolium castaneum]EEZ99070.2 Tubulin beta-3 chain-like Protein [Tribolium castaneum]|eukprot:XP_008200949.1 PREDICTED: tubulin epsilon chain [Tribolium castaneum]
MSEFIVIQVGQCGNQIGSFLLPEILQEYGVKTTTDSPAKPKRNKAELQQFMSSFFNMDPTNTTIETLSDLLKSKAKARFLCIDMEDSVVARFKSGRLRDLFDSKSLITHYPGSGNNWAEGYCSHGPKFKQKILKAIQYNVEKCDHLHGFLVLFSMGGGTGSGLGTFIVKLLADFFPHIDRFVACVYPTGTEDVITGPYNMAFATEQLLESATCVFPVENRALLDIALRHTGRYSARNKTYFSPFRPFEDMNKIIVDMILHLTSGSRFGGKMNIDMNEINTNMVPFPKLNFLASGYSPFRLKNFNSSAHSDQLKNELFLASCSRNNQLIKVDPFDSRYMAMSVTLLGRGNYSINDMRGYIDRLKSKLHFACWSNKAVKVGLCNVAPKGLDFSMFSLCNTSSTSNLFQEVLNQFTKLYQRKAHVHHYTAISGFDFDQFKECQNSISNIIEFYQEIGKRKTL